MTRDKWAKLSPEEQRVKVAEAEGFVWEDDYFQDGSGCWVYPDGREVTRADHFSDYLNDLNAMHEAEKLLDNGVDDTRYINRLVEICEESIYNQPFRSVRATAAQRAEAFVLTLSPDV